MPKSKYYCSKCLYCSKSDTLLKCSIRAVEDWGANCSGRGLECPWSIRGGPTFSAARHVCTLGTIYIYIYIYIYTHIYTQRESDLDLSLSLYIYI